MLLPNDKTLTIALEFTSPKDTEQLCELYESIIFSIISMSNDMLSHDNIDPLLFLLRDILPNPSQIKIVND